MKYSLRSLMIGVTLICVVLGSVTGRVEYLRQWAVYHEQAAEQSGTNVLEWDDHNVAALHYRIAMWRPWTIVRPSMRHRKYHTQNRYSADEFWYDDLPPEPPDDPHVREAKKRAADDEKWAAEVEKLIREQSSHPSRQPPSQIPLSSEP